MTQQSASVEHALMRSTVRLLAGVSGQPPTSVGTGFFYKVVHPTAGIGKLLIVTNKHVVRGAEVIHFVLSSAPSVSSLDQHQQPLGRTDQPVSWPLAGNLYTHPDPEVDLCAVDVTIPTGLVIQNGQQLRSAFLDATWLPDEPGNGDFIDIERSLVVGYPRGIWDEHNNMPIARLGVTATHPRAHYQGKRNFLLDVAAFQGSSGSPVFAYESPFYRAPDGSVTPGTRARLLGVIWGVLEWGVQGELRVVEIPSVSTQVPVINTSMNLGIALHGDLIRDLDHLVFPRINVTAST